MSKLHAQEKTIFKSPVQTAQRSAMCGCALRQSAFLKGSRDDKSWVRAREFCSGPRRPTTSSNFSHTDKSWERSSCFQSTFLLFESYTFAKICDLRCTRKQNFHPRLSRCELQPTDRRRHISTSAQGCHASYRTFCKPPTFNQAYRQGARSTLDMVPGRFCGFYVTRKPSLPHSTTISGNSKENRAARIQLESNSITNLSRKHADHDFSWIHLSTQFLFSK